MNIYIVTCWYKSYGDGVISTFLIRAISRDEAQRHILESYKTLFGDVEPEIKDAYKHGQFSILRADDYTVRIR